MNTKTLYRIVGTLVGLFALLLQYYLVYTTAERTGTSQFSELVRYLSFMTIWTNIVVTACFGFPLLFPRSAPGRFFQRPVVESAVMLYISVVMIVYHFLLSKVWDPQGWQKIADVSLHYVVPILFIIYWILFTPKGFLNYTHPFLWLVYPVAYIVYSLVRGAITNQYAYYFVDAHTLGYPVALKNTLFILIGFLLLGLLVVLIDRLITSGKTRKMKVVN